jgi:hypothetical protein
VEVDHRGEMLIYREARRSADVICTFCGRPCIVSRTLSGWWYPAEQRSEPMTPGARVQVLERIADYCRGRLGMANLRFEGDEETR